MYRCTHTHTHTLCSFSHRHSSPSTSWLLCFCLLKHRVVHNILVCCLLLKMTFCVTGLLCSKQRTAVKKKVLENSVRIQSAYVTNHKVASANREMTDDNYCAAICPLLRRNWEEMKSFNPKWDYDSWANMTGSCGSLPERTRGCFNASYWWTQRLIHIRLIL